jgi:DNA-binding response OmpR family regulator
MKILLVEDDPDIRVIYKKMLSNYDVEAIADGGKVIRLYKAELLC